MAFLTENQRGDIWMDGRLVRWNDAQAHVMSHGLNYASCVFEGERVYAGKIFKLVEHTQRLLDSADILGLAHPYTLKQLCDATEQVVAAQSLRNGYVRPLVWKGDEDISVFGAKASTHIAIGAIPMGDIFPPEVKAAGIRLKTSSWKRSSADTAPVRAKASCHYATGRLAMVQARDAGFHDALMLDLGGDVAESSGSNIFMAKNGTLYTPTTECALDGITRRTVMEIAARRGIKVVEKKLRPEDFREADEAFLTGTAYEIIGIGCIDDHDFTGARPITETMIVDYDALTGKETVR